MTERNGANALDYCVNLRNGVKEFLLLRGGEAGEMNVGAMKRTRGANVAKRVNEIKPE